MTITYYEHINQNGLPTGPKAKHLGTAKYGYASLAIAIRFCPPGAMVQERHTSGNNDWAGNIVFVKPD